MAFITISIRCQKLDIEQNTPRWGHGGVHRREAPRSAETPTTPPTTPPNRKTFGTSRSAYVKVFMLFMCVAFFGALVGACGCGARHPGHHRRPRDGLAVHRRGSRSPRTLCVFARLLLYIREDNTWRRATTSACTLRDVQPRHGPPSAVGVTRVAPRASWPRCPSPRFPHLPPLCAPADDDDVVEAASLSVAHGGNRSASTYVARPC